MTKKRFSLFHSSIDLAHNYWRNLLRPGDCAIDATCGNGKDTLQLAQILNPNGTLIGIDIQQEAIDKTSSLLRAHFSFSTLQKIHLYCQSHVHFPPLAFSLPVHLIVYNLGYLPGGNKELTTLTSSTVESVLAALQLITPGGAISLTCYPGHLEGAREEKALIDIALHLPIAEFNICLHTFPNRFSSPSLLFIQKKI